MGRAWSTRHHELMPLSRADVKIGFACNNRCVFCAQGERRRICGAVPFEELARRLSEIRKTTRGLVLTGGEPTLHKRIVPIVRAAAALGFRPIQIQTNGRMLAYRNVLDALVEAGATEFSPSLHGSTRALHDALTRAEGSYDETVAGIVNAVGTGLVVTTNSVIVRRNVEDLPALVALLAGLGVSQMQLAFVHPVGTAAELFDDVVPRLSDVERAILGARDVARARQVRLVTEAIPLCFLGGDESLAVEAAIPDTTVVDLDGGVVSYSTWRTTEGKTHGPPCAHCTRRPRCEGPWREYPVAFGWAEFRPRVG